MRTIRKSRPFFCVKNKLVVLCRCDFFLILQIVSEHISYHKIMALEQRIEQLLDAGERQEAIQELEQYWKQDPNNEDVLLKLGELIYAEGKMTEALNKFNALLRLNPEHQKAQNYVTMINGILEYFCKDLLNP